MSKPDLAVEIRILGLKLETEVASRSAATQELADGGAPGKWHEAHEDAVAGLVAAARALVAKADGGA
jgi:hypothetical protein